MEEMKIKRLNSKMTSKIHIKFEKEIIQNTNFLEFIFEIDSENNSYINGFPIIFRIFLSILFSR